MQDIMKKSVKVTSETIEVSTFTGRKSNLTVVKIVTALRSKGYAHNNGVTAFVYDGNLYVTPFNVIKELQRYGYAEEYFYVPFSNTSHPLDAEEQWRSLCEAAREERYALADAKL